MTIGIERARMGPKFALRNDPTSWARDISSCHLLRNTGTLDPWLIESEHFVSRSSRSAQVLPGEERVQVGEWA